MEAKEAIRSFSWVPGVVVLAIALALVLGVDHTGNWAASNDGGSAVTATHAPLRSSLRTLPRLLHFARRRPTEWRLTKLTIVAKAEAHSAGTLCGPARLVAQKIIEMAQGGVRGAKQSTLPGTPRIPKR